MKNVVIVGGMIKGVGISQYIYDTYSNISNDSLNFLFVNESGVNDFQSQMKKLGWHTVYISPWKKNPIKYFTDWFSFLKKNHNNIDVIHFHYDQLSKFWPFLLLRVFPVKHIIIHSHNSSNTDMSKQILMRYADKLGKIIIRKMPIIRLSVSKLAGEWLFGDAKFRVVHNGVDVTKFKFREEVREKYRTKYGLKNGDFAIGHVGRFKAQKNHFFLLNEFKKVTIEYPMAKLFLIGIGPLQQKVKSRVQELGIQDKVIFLNLRNDVSELLNMFDLFLLPSLYEGFPIALIEAQANGLPVVYSDSITKTIELTDRIEAAKLNDLNDWLLKIKSTMANPTSIDQRVAAVKDIKVAGYDLNVEANKLADFYLSLK